MNGQLATLGSVFLILMMLSIGLQVSPGEMASDIRGRRFLARAFFANLVLVPLLGVALVRLFGLEGDVAAGFLLLALAPGAPFAVNFTSKAKGGLDLAAALLFALVVAALIFTPLLADLALPGQAQVTLPYSRVVGKVVLLLVLPFAVGLIVRSQSRALAEKIAKPATLLAILAFVGFMVTSLGTTKPARAAVGGPAVVAMLVFIAASMLIGWLIGGPDRPSRQVMAVGTSMRNVAVALLLAQSLDSDTVRFVVIAFFSLMVPCNLVLTIFESVMYKRTQVPAEVA